MNDLALRELRCKVYNAALDARAMSRLVEGDAFKRAWSSVPEEQRYFVANLIRLMDKLSVERWVRTTLSQLDSGEKSIKELRVLAKLAGIPYVNNLTKEQLLDGLRKDEVDEPPTGTGQRDQTGPAQGGDQRT